MTEQRKEKEELVSTKKIVCTTKGRRILFSLKRVKLFNLFAVKNLRHRKGNLHRLFPPVTL